MTGSTEESLAVDDAAIGIRAWLGVYLKGVAMGAADTVPGVSGGTIALITGIYERLVTAITALDPRVLGGLRGLHTVDGRRSFLADLRRMDLVFLIVLGAGMVTAVVGLSRVVHASLEAYRAGTFAFFFGLIAASAVVLYRQIRIRSVGEVLASVLGVVVAFVVAGASSSGFLGHALPVVFLSGAIGITAMVLPGVSGSFLLILLGQYEYLIEVLEGFVDGLLATLTGGSADGLVHDATIVGTFLVGAVIGVVTVAHAIRWALDHYRGATLAFLVSLMVGSLRLPAVEVGENVGTWNITAAAGILFATLVGAGAVLLLDLYTDDLDYGAHA